MLRPGKAMIAATGAITAPAPDQRATVHHGAPDHIAPRRSPSSGRRAVPDDPGPLRPVPRRDQPRVLSHVTMAVGLRAVPAVPPPATIANARIRPAPALHRAAVFVASTAPRPSIRATVRGLATLRPGKADIVATDALTAQAQNQRATVHRDAPDHIAVRSRPNRGRSPVPDDPGPLRLVPSRHQPGVLPHIMVAAGVQTVPAIPPAPLLRAAIADARIRPAPAIHRVTTVLGAAGVTRPPSVRISRRGSAMLGPEEGGIVATDALTALAPGPRATVRRDAPDHIKERSGRSSGRWTGRLHPLPRRSRFLTGAAEKESTVLAVAVGRAVRRTAAAPESATSAADVARGVQERPGRPLGTALTSHSVPAVVPLLSHNTAGIAPGSGYPAIGSSRTRRPLLAATPVRDATALDLRRPVAPTAFPAAIIPAPALSSARRGVVARREETGPLPLPALVHAASIEARSAQGGAMTQHRLETIAAAPFREAERAVRPRAASPPVDVRMIADRVYDVLVSRLRQERRARGL
jgi:hypothetical protein